MTDREFKKLSRGDLVNIIYEMQKNEQALNEELDQAKSALTDKTMKISQAGSIAEAVLGLNEIFERAQSAADSYLEQIQDNSQKQESLVANAEREAAQIRGSAEGEAAVLLENARNEAAALVETAKSEASEIRQKAESEAAAMLEKAESESAAKWELFNRKVNEILQAHKELQSLLKGTEA